MRTRTRKRQSRTNSLRRFRSSTRSGSCTRERPRAPSRSKSKAMSRARKANGPTQKKCSRKIPNQPTVTRSTRRAATWTMRANVSRLFPPTMKLQCNYRRASIRSWRNSPTLRFQVRPTKWSRNLRGNPPCMKTNGRDGKTKLVHRQAGMSIAVRTTMRWRHLVLPPRAPIANASKTSSRT